MMGGVQIIDMNDEQLLTLVQLQALVDGTVFVFRLPTRSVKASLHASYGASATRT